MDALLPGTPTSNTYDMSTLISSPVDLKKQTCDSWVLTWWILIILIHLVAQWMEGGENGRGSWPQASSKGIEEPNSVPLLENCLGTGLGPLQPGQYSPVFI